MKICAIIPSYNEEENIVNVINGVQKNNVDPVVIDDGSTDKTYELAKMNDAVVIKHDTKKGKGSSLRDGLAWASQRGYDYIFTIDADGQHNPDEIPCFMKEADSDKDAGIIIGNRMMNPENMPLLRIHTNRFMSNIISGLCSQHIPDTQCGYKLIRANVLKDIQMDSKKFEIESELLVKTAKAGFKIKSVLIKSIYAKEKSRINPITDTLRFARFLIRAFFFK